MVTSFVRDLDKEVAGTPARGIEPAQREVPQRRAQNDLPGS